MTLYDIPLRTITGEDTTLAPYRGKVMLVVNVASQCGKTPQYAGLEALQREFGPQGFSVLGFPCNQFMGQEPGTGADIQQFCESMYGVTFPLFEKIDVNGPHTHPLYRKLKRAKPQFLWIGTIPWNFTKFLVARDGRVVRRYAPNTEPLWLRNAIVRELGPATNDRGP